MKLKQTILNRINHQPKITQHKSQRKQNTQKLIKPTKLEQTRVMNKKNGYVKSYSANTFHGLVRNYNEDRVSIILNITKPDSIQKWPKCSYFAIFDGHGGSLCSDFLRDNLHKYIIQDSHFPFKPIEALKYGFEKAQNQFKKIAEQSNPINKSGSCAIVVLIIDKYCYTANVGDSRAIISMNKGKQIIPLSEDHKPNRSTQKQRILKYGGNVYQSTITTKTGQIIPGPHRIFPGRLSVSRAIGDIQAKDPKYEGNANVLISQPEISCLQIEPSQHDFIIIGCDGIYDKLTNEEVIQTVWKFQEKSQDKQNYIGDAISGILQLSMRKKSMDNITAVLIMIDKDEKRLQKIESKKSLSSNNLWSQLQNKKVNLKMDESDRRKSIESCSKQNKNTMNRLYNMEEHKSSLDNKELQRQNIMKKKGSMGLSNKKMQYLKNNNEMFSKKKMHEYIRY